VQASHLFIAMAGKPLQKIILIFEEKFFRAAVRITRALGLVVILADFRAMFIPGAPARVAQFFTGCVELEVPFAVVIDPHPHVFVNEIPHDVIDVFEIRWPAYFQTDVFTALRATGAQRPVFSVIALALPKQLMLRNDLIKG
jgi:hypothetical protein